MKRSDYIKAIKELNPETNIKFLSTLRITFLISYLNQLKYSKEI